MFTSSKITSITTLVRKTQTFQRLNSCETAYAYVAGMPPATILTLLGLLNEAENVQRVALVDFSQRAFRRRTWGEALKAYKESDEVRGEAWAQEVAARALDAWRLERRFESLPMEQGGGSCYRAFIVKRKGSDVF